MALRILHRRSAHLVSHKGSVIVNTEPCSRFSFYFQFPPCAFTISYARDNPKPVPCPVGLVVKKG